MEPGLSQVRAPVLYNFVIRRRGVVQIYSAPFIFRLLDQLLAAFTI